MRGEIYQMSDKCQVLDMANNWCLQPPPMFSGDFSSLTKMTHYVYIIVFLYLKHEH